MGAETVIVRRMAEQLAGYSYGRDRFLECVPALLSWTTILGAIVLSFMAPYVAILLIIVFDVYWLFRIVYFVVYLIAATRLYHSAASTDWAHKLSLIGGTERIVHLVFLPTYKEGKEILQTTLTSLTTGTLSSRQMMIVLCGEEREGKVFTQIADELKQEFSDQFLAFFVTVHPKNIPGDLPGKGSNLHYAGGEVAKRLAAEWPQIKDDQIIVSAFDADTIAHRAYFSYLTYLYLTVDQPTRTSYQPVALFNNNIWSSSAPVRISAFGTTFWLLSELARPERLWTFSSHSMPWVMLKDVGFWQRDIVSEDSRIFLQALLHYHGDYRVTPMFLPVSMDTVTGDSYMDSLKALYKQQRRWAWGVEHLPVLIRAFQQDSQISLRTKLTYLFNHLEGMYTWATAPLLIFILGWLPLWVAESQTSALVNVAPFTLERLMQLATVGIVACGILSLRLMPPRPKTASRTTWILMIAQWLLMPITFIFLGAFPALDAQTRYAFGRYLGFQVTEKSVRTRT